MRALRWLPLAFFAGFDGFAMFAPYLTAIAILWLTMQARRRVALAAVPA